MADNSTDFDVIIIGGGPGGLSAAMWCADLGLKAVVFEKEPEFGGQLLWTFNAIENYLGIAAANGRELRDRFLQHVENKKFKRLTEAFVVGADLARKRVTLADGTSYSAKAIIIATGVRRRKLDVPGEEQFIGRGILESGAKSKDDVKNKTVAIIGGGDAALENALILSQTAKRVFVIHRKNKFTARPEFVENARRCENVEFIFDTCVTAISGNKRVEAVELQNTKSAERSKIASDALLIRIGVVPNTEMFSGQIALDESGYIMISSDCQTSLQDIYAIGDAANQFSPTIAAAAGQGAIAARTIFTKKDQ